MDNHQSLSYNPPGVDSVWQHHLETVGCIGPVKSVGVAAEGKGVLVLRYSKGTKDTSTTASPKETHGKVDLLHPFFIRISKSVVHSRTKIRLFHCNTWMGLVSQRKLQNETSSQLVRGGSLCIRKSQG